MNRRFLTEESIKSFAKSHDFQSFQSYIISADAYVINGDKASKFFIEFIKQEDNSQERKTLYNKMRNDEY